MQRIRQPHKNNNTWLFSRERLWNSVVHFSAKRTRDYCFANRCVKLGFLVKGMINVLRISRNNFAHFAQCRFTVWIALFSEFSATLWSFFFSILSSWEWYFLSPSLWQKGLSQFAAEVPTAPSDANAPLPISHHFTAEISSNLGWWASDYLEGSIKVIDVDVITGLLNWAVNTASSPDFLDLNFHLSVI